MPYIQIGTPGVAWGDSEREKWRSLQSIKRSYNDEVLVKIEEIKARNCFDVENIGNLSYDVERYPLYVVKTRLFNSNKKTIIVTGGVHGYETSGVQGALRFIETEMGNYGEKFNIMVFPCVSPWGYETINRWNPLALDPNRNFTSVDSKAEECANVMKYISSFGDVYAHFDLHETTDTDNSTFRPALAERDGKILEIGGPDWSEIPDGFYLVANTVKPVMEFQSAIIAGVEGITHIAPCDSNNCIIGTPLSAKGVIHYPAKQLGLCMGMANAEYATTTEVYPDSPNASPEICIKAQVKVVTTGLHYLLNL